MSVVIPEAISEQEADDFIPPVPHLDPDYVAKIDKRHRDRLLAKSVQHLLTHTPSNPHCEGCRAKSRNLSHFRDAFENSQNDDTGFLTMDHVSIVDKWHSNGIGGYKYAILFRQVDTGY